MLPYWLVLFGCASQAAVIAGLGIRAGVDTAHYLDAATRLLTGQLLGPRQAEAPAYTALLAASLCVTGRPEWALTANVILTVGTGLSLFALGRALHGPATGALAAVAYFLHLDVQRWTAYLLPETLATTALVGLLWATLIAPAAVLPVGALLALARPKRRYS